MIRISWLLTFTLILSGFSHNLKADEVETKGFEVKVTSNLPDKSMVVFSQIVNDQLKILDTAYSVNGKFNFKGNAEKTGSIFYLTFGSANPPGVPLILVEGDRVAIEIDKGDVIRFTSTGGKFMPSMVKLHNLYTDFDKKMMEFNAEVALYNDEEVSEEVRKEVPIRYNALIGARSLAIENFIKTEPASPATYFATKFLFQKPVPKIIMLGKDKMVAELPNSPYTKNLVEAAAALGPTVPGAIAPEIKLPSPDGDSVALSDLRGKVVLIDFWASWCGPCRKENPAVKKVYEKYKDKGFEIYGVSLDNDSRRWSAAIDKDGLPWYHVSDLKGWGSSASRLYGVRSIPQTFLIDEEGRIIKSGMRAHELDLYLQQLLGS